MSKINYTVLKNELIRDPIEMGYRGMTYDDIASAMNSKHFSEAALYDEESGLQIFYATGKSASHDGEPKQNTVGEPVVVGIAFNQVKRSRAELLFGPDAVVAAEDIRLSYLS